jgi:hypothetical protein
MYIMFGRLKYGGSDRFILMSLVWHPISQIYCVAIGPTVDFERDIMSKFGAGVAGGVFFPLKSLGI